MQMFQIYGGHFDCDRKQQQLQVLEKKQLDPSFWNDKEQADAVISEITHLKSVLKEIEPLKQKAQDNLELALLLKEDFEQGTALELETEYHQLGKELSDLSQLLLLNGEYDMLNCIVEIHAGAGGTEACDWANMLYRMYTRYIEKHDYRLELLDYQEGEEAGIKSVTFLVKGAYAYGYLKSEKGVHRLVRLSPFDSSNRRHTSFASVEVTPEITKDIDITIEDKDIRIDVYRSTGAGGQGVNTTDSAVRITHLPTGIVVTCQNERSQIQNKETALKVLKSKLYVLERQKMEQKMAVEKGEQRNIEFGSQIRSYVMHPYSMVKDHRTGYETSNVKAVLDGQLDEFMESYLKGEKNGD